MKIKWYFHCVSWGYNVHEICKIRIKCDWLRKWRAITGPITYQNKAIPRQSNCNHGLLSTLNEKLRLLEGKISSTKLWYLAAMCNGVSPEPFVMVAPARYFIKMIDASCVWKKTDINDISVFRLVILPSLQSVKWRPSHITSSAILSLNECN